MVKRSRSKRYLENKKKVSEKKTSILNDAIKAFKSNKAVKFDETLDISVMLNKEKNKKFCSIYKQKKIKRKKRKKTRKKSKENIKEKRKRKYKENKLKKK